MRVFLLFRVLCLVDGTVLNVSFIDRENGVWQLEFAQAQGASQAVRATQGMRFMGAQLRVSHEVSHTAACACPPAHAANEGRSGGAGRGVAERAFLVVFVRLSQVSESESTAARREPKQEQHLTATQPQTKAHDQGASGSAKPASSAKSRAKSSSKSKHAKPKLKSSKQKPVSSSKPTARSAEARSTDSKSTGPYEQNYKNYVLKVRGQPAMGPAGSLLPSCAQTRWGAVVCGLCTHAHTTHHGIGIPTAHLPLPPPVIYMRGHAFCTTCHQRTADVGHQESA